MERYEQDLWINSNEKANGFALWGTQGPIMEEKLYVDLIRLWKCSSDFPDFEQFSAECGERMCSDWSKQDEHGECFGGFWEYPDDSYESKHAYYLSRRKNILELYKLPFPDLVLIETVRLGCNIRRESVRYSNFICEWLRRKYESLNRGESTPALRIKIPVFPVGWSEAKYMAIPGIIILQKNLKKLAFLRKVNRRAVLKQYFCSDIVNIFYSLTFRKNEK